VDLGWQSKVPVRPRGNSGRKWPSVKIQLESRDQTRGNSDTALCNESISHYIVQDIFDYFIFVAPYLQNNTLLEWIDFTVAAWRCL
jgi:hypothetical protein